MARTLLRLMLIRDGFDVVEANDGHDALNKLEDNSPELIILDVMMPGLNGFELCKQLRTIDKTASLPIFMLSARTDAESIAQGMEAGATKYLKKPVSARGLTGEIREAFAAAATI